MVKPHTNQMLPTLTKATISVLHLSNSKEQIYLRYEVITNLLALRNP